MSNNGKRPRLASLRVLEAVGKVKPRAFVIDLLSSRHAELREHMVEYLQNLRGPDGKRLYKIRMRVLDTKFVGGLPQSRARVYIVGWRRVDECMAFIWPAPLQAVPFSSLIDRSATATTRVHHGRRGLSTRAKRAVVCGEEEIRRRGGNPAEERRRGCRAGGAGCRRCAAPNDPLSLPRRL